MPDDSRPTSNSTPSGMSSTASQRHGLLRRHWGKMTLTTILITPLLVFTIWAGLALAFTYSSGDRVGFIQKLARKGWLCKTWEGELQLSNVPGSAPTIFFFTVRSDSIAEEVRKLEGRQVSIHYSQHIGVPSRCFGDTEYFIIGVRAIEAAR